MTDTHISPVTATRTTLIICSTAGCNTGKGPCDWSGWIEFTEPTTGRVTGGTACCKKCGMFAIDHSLRYGA
jgi:hypothetical protein